MDFSIFSAKVCEKDLSACVLHILHIQIDPSERVR